MLDLIQQSVKYIKDKTQVGKIEIGLVLGSGLGGFIEQIDVTSCFDYEEIPNFPVSTVEGHNGKLIFGKIEGIPIVVLQGRFHYYEGYSLKQTTFPIRVLKTLGVECLLLSNASGGLSSEHKIGDLMIINDHIHMFPDNPLRGKNEDQFGSRFPDMSEAYSKDLIKEARDICKREGLLIHEGVYLGAPGPNYETPAEYKFFRKIGADAVGMSTTSETIVAVHSGMKVFAVSIIADLGVEGKIEEISHDLVQQVALSVGPNLSILLKNMVKTLSLNSLIST